MGWNFKLGKKKTPQRKMGILTGDEINSLMNSGDLYIAPLLEKSQIGEISVDFRVGTDFLSLHPGREAFIDTTNDNISERPIKSHYSETRRRVGESFLLHPSQPVLFSTLEFVKIPDDVYLDLTLRSSYNRLGLTLSAIVQPGYCGCISVEVVNNGGTPIKIMSGSRFVQARFYRSETKTDYFNQKRKYTCQVRPVPSKANEDEDLEKLSNIKKQLKASSSPQ